VIKYSRLIGKFAVKAICRRLRCDEMRCYPAKKKEKKVVCALSRSMRSMREHLY